jgi:hypothetical protein
VDDVKAVVMMIAMHRPNDALELAQAQCDTTIMVLNKYIEEAEQRSARHVGTEFSSAVTWTSTGEKGKKK